MSEGRRLSGHAVREPAQPADIPPLQARQAGEPLSRRVSRLADRFVHWLSRHWLAVLNSLALAYVGLPLLAPVLLYLGLEWPGMAIHAVYRPLCHQLPQRSFFIFGPQLTYSVEELAVLLGPAFVDAPWSGAFVGNAEIGYKMALCQRDTAIYGAILLAGLAYGLLRRRWRVPPLPWWGYLGFGVVPMLVDGGYQWISYAVALLVPGSSLLPHETTPVLRVVTGGLFGLCTVWLAYPHVAETMEDVRSSR